MKRKEAPSPASTPHLAERVEKLSIKRQEIVRPILEHPREYVLLSVRAMAARLRTDPATIVRIVRGLGFGSYREFQRHLHELSLAYATSLDTMQSRGSDGNMPSHVRDSLEQDLKNLQGLKNSLDAPRLVALAKRFYEARRIVLFCSPATWPFSSRTISNIRSVFWVSQFLPLLPRAGFCILSVP